MNSNPALRLLNRNCNPLIRRAYGITLLQFDKILLQYLFSCSLLKREANVPAVDEFTGNLSQAALNTNNNQFANSSYFSSSLFLTKVITQVSV